MAVYMGARPFSLFEDFYIKAFVDLLGDSLYKAPSRIQIGSDLLEKAYKTLQCKILQILEEQSHL
jgi:hypothetical protein